MSYTSDVAKADGAADTDYRANWNVLPFLVLPVCCIDYYKGTVLTRMFDLYPCRLKAVLGNSRMKAKKQNPWSAAKGKTDPH